jgi:hypothetical protein
MKYLEILKLVVSILPLLINLIQAAEAAFPASGQGAAKLDMVRAVLQQSYDFSNDKIAKFEDVWPAIQNIVATIVSTYNALGNFKKA